jgi:IclR helix-turn-helix domain
MRANAQELLQALAGEPAPVSVYALRTGLGMAKDNAHRAIHVLVRRGLVTQAHYGRYRITDEGRAWLVTGRLVNRGRHPRSPQAVRSGTLRERFWRAMRMMRRFTVADLAQMAAGPEGRDPRSGAKHYVKALERAGFLRRLPGPRNRAGTWMLVRNSGPRPPVLNKRETALHDPNTGESYELRRSA